MSDRTNLIDVAITEHYSLQMIADLELPSSGVGSIPAKYVIKKNDPYLNTYGLAMRQLDKLSSKPNLTSVTWADWTDDSPQKELMQHIKLAVEKKNFLFANRLYWSYWISQLRFIQMIHFYRSTELLRGIKSSLYGNDLISAGCLARAYAETNIKLSVFWFDVLDIFNVPKVPNFSKELVDFDSDMQKKILETIYETRRLFNFVTENGESRDLLKNSDSMAKRLDVIDKGLSSRYKKKISKGYLQRNYAFLCELTHPNSVSYFSYAERRQDDVYSLTPKSLNTPISDIQLIGLRQILVGVSFYTQMLVHTFNVLPVFDPWLKKLRLPSYFELKNLSSREAL